MSIIPVRLRITTQSDNGLDAARQQTESLNRSLAQAQHTLQSIVGVMSAAHGITAVGKLSDEYTLLQSRLKLVTDSSQELAEVQARLEQMADANRQNLTQTVNLYAGIEPAMQRSGKSAAEVAKVVDTVTKSLVIGGSTVQGSAASILQLTQALGSGVLRGDEFNSIMENGRGIAQALADALGKDVGQLRALAEQQKLTSDVVIAALIEQNDEVTAKFGNMTKTMGQSVEVLRNNLMTSIGEFDQYYNVSKTVADSIIGLANNLEYLGVPLAAIGTYLAGKALTSTIGYVAALQAQSAANLRAATTNNMKLASDVAAANAERIRTAAVVAGIQAQMASTTAIHAAMIAQRELIPAQIQSTLAANAYTTALAAQRAGMVATSTASRMLAGSLALVGGPLGLAMIAAAGLYAYKVSADNARESVELANGVELTFGESLDYVTTVSNEYRTASQSRQAEIRAEIQLIIQQTEARKREAEDQLKYLQQLNKNGNQGLFGWARELGSKFFNGDQQENRQVIAETSGTLTKLKASLENLGKTQEEVAGTSTKLGDATGKSAKELLEYSDKAKKVQDAAKKQADALKSTVESLTQQRLGLVEGARAADYYADRLKGLSAVQAMLSGTASQYNAYLEERQRLLDESKTIKGGIVDEYNVHMRDIGLDKKSGNFVNAERAAQLALAAQEGLKKSAEAAAKSLQEQGKAATDSATQTTQAAQQSSAEVQQVQQKAKSMIEQGISTAKTALLDYFGFNRDLQQQTLQTTRTVADEKVKINAKTLAEMRSQAVKHAATLAMVDREALKAGVDPIRARTMAFIESRFDPNADHNPDNIKSAKGVFQFTKPTADAYGLTDRFDPVANTRAYIQLLKDNTKALQKAGLEADGFAQYMAHQQGAGTYISWAKSAQQGAPLNAGMRNNIPDNMRGNDSAAFIEAWREKYKSFEHGIRILAGEQGKVTQEVVKTTAATAASIAPAKAITDQTKQTAIAKQQEIQVARYQGTFDTKRVGDKEREWLLSQKLQNEADKLLQTAKEQVDATQLGGLALRDKQLRQKQYTDALREEVLATENNAEYLGEEKKLREQMAAIRDPLESYKSDLAKRKLSDTQVLSLAAQKQAVDFERVKYSLEQQSEAVHQNGEEQWAAAQKVAGLTGKYLEQAKALHYSTTLAAEHKKLAQELDAVNLDPIALYGKRLQDDTGLKKPDALVLQNEKLKNKAAEVTKELKQQKDAIAQNGEEQWAAAQKVAGLTGKYLEQAKALHYSITLETELKKLRDQEARVGLKPRDLAVLDYKDQGLNPKDAKDTGQRKVDLSGKERIEELKRQREELTMSAEAYKNLNLERQQYSKGITDTIKAMEAQNTKLAESRKLAEGLGDTLRDSLTSKLKDAAHTGNDILDALVSKIIDSMMQTQAMQSMFSTLGTGMASGVTGVLGSIGSLIGGLFAQGGAFTGGTQFYATGGVVERTTAFGMAGNRMGIMGEAGPEAIMPLARTSGGDLGIKMVNPPQPPINITMLPQILLQQPTANQTRTSTPVTLTVINNGAPQEASVEERQRSDGGTDFTLTLDMLEREMASRVRRGGTLGQSIQQRYGLNPVAGSFR